MWWSFFFFKKWISIRQKKTNLNVIQNKYDDEQLCFNELHTKMLYGLVSY